MKELPADESFVAFEQPGQHGVGVATLGFLSPGQCPRRETKACSGDRHS